MNDKAMIFPALKYDDAPGAVAWLQKAFGFAEHAVHKGPDGGIAHAEMKLGNAMIMFGSTGKPDPANPWSTERMGIYMCVPDIDAHYARAVVYGVQPRPGDSAPGRACVDAAVLHG